MNSRVLAVLKNYSQITSEKSGIKTVFRGTRGKNNSFSNPDALKEANGFYGRGTDDSISFHRYAANSTIYIPTTLSESQAADFAGYGWVHMMQLPQIYVYLPNVHPYLPPIPDEDEVLGQAIMSEREVSAVQHIPWTDVLLSRQVFSPPMLPFRMYLGEGIENPDFQLRNYSCEILSASADEAEFVLSHEHFQDPENKMKALSLEAAKEIAEALKEESLTYKLHLDSPHLTVGPIVESRKSLAIICDDYRLLMKESNVKPLKTIHSYADAKAAFFNVKQVAQANGGKEQQQDLKTREEEGGIKLKN
ncbi:MAG TPA: hypothetical protein VLH77_06410 [Gammaproteobacteria bacterium]|nr:hypothetical protein [Gammaproteobacteria bacterium]